MPIDPKVAVRIAREKGLTLSDARALSAMAESEDDAAELADAFVDPKDDPILSVFDKVEL